MSYASKRKDQLNDIKAARTRPARVSRRINSEGWKRAPTDDELGRIVAQCGDVSLCRIEVFTDGSGFTLATGNDRRSRITFHQWGEQKRLREHRNSGIKVYAAGQKTSIVYDPQTKAPYVFKTGDARSQKAEIRAIMNSPEWQAEHKLPEDCEVHITE